MLSATLSYSAKADIKSILTEHKFQLKVDTYQYYVENKKLIESTIHSSNGTITLTFRPDLNLEEYTEIHEIICSLAGKLNAQIDDSESLLGYLKTGEGAYIVTNWQHWYEFLQAAKMTTLEGQKVRVLDENKKEIASGMFVDYKKEDQTSTIIECTLITLFGERTFKGKNLTIEPTNEW